MTKSHISPLLSILFPRSGIVFANKAVFMLGFRFTCALTLIHTLTTMAGMSLFARFGVFQRKPLPQSKLVQLAASYVGYIVLCNLSLRLNTVGFYQVCAHVCIKTCGHMHGMGAWDTGSVLIRLHVQWLLPCAQHNVWGPSGVDLHSMAA